MIRLTIGCRSTVSFAFYSNHYITSIGDVIYNSLNASDDAGQATSEFFHFGGEFLRFNEKGEQHDDKSQTGQHERTDCDCAHMISEGSPKSGGE